MKVYLSGPITGVPDFEKNFARAEEQVKKWTAFHNLEVINPVLVGKETEKKFNGKKPNWQNYMKDCIRELVTCDAIIMLPDWNKSRGAREEKRIAELLDIAVICIDETGEVTQQWIYGHIRSMQ